MVCAPERRAKSRRFADSPNEVKDTTIARNSACMPGDEPEAEVRRVANEYDVAAKDLHGDFAKLNFP